jgi:hypothetical protein
VREAGNGRHFPVAEVPGQHEDALATLQGAREHRDIFDLDFGGFLFRAHEAKAQEFDEQAPQMSVMRLRESRDLGVGHARTEYSAQVFDNDPAAKRQ